MRTPTSMTSSFFQAFTHYLALHCSERYSRPYPNPCFILIPRYYVNLATITFPRLSFGFHLPACLNTVHSINPLAVCVIIVYSPPFIFWDYPYPILSLSYRTPVPHFEAITTALYIYDPIVELTRSRILLTIAKCLL
ncbi:hypothetical protein JB92DRAFT_3038779 [Gautieria morchelliformis]|nr:hypothetical protein JB92DRAFT_3038779 [Gautieria morchelliformis]